MDNIDRANRDMEMYEKHRPKFFKKEAEPTGYCLFCDEPVPDNRRWCCPACRNMWEKLQKRMRHK